MFTGVLQNGRLAASALLRACEVHSGGSNFTLLLQHRVESFELCQSTGRATAVQTEKRRCELRKIQCLKNPYCKNAAGVV